ncbi:efflux RND transporter permease subunit [Pseudomonas sp. LRF_L74]|uniref:efflux RND transporter permease subunit n=1 Tax=Pseudomonas sp. LRF_L74 TaxID=3369422 RepID=UPI003F640AF3
MRSVAWLETLFFAHRRSTLGLMLLFTLIMGWYALQLRMDAGFEKQLPIGHEYVETFQQYRDELPGANRLTVVLRARQGEIWSVDGLRRLYDLTQAVQALPSLDRVGVQSLWTPNSFVSEITEEGFRAEPLIDGTVSPQALDPAAVKVIREAATRGGFIGTLVARDHSSAMVTADLYEFDQNGGKLDYVAYNHLLEEKLRKAFEDKDYEIQIIGFAKQVGDIADGASNVLVFCVIALLLTLAAVYWYCHSVSFTLLPILCSLTSLVWQFGALRLLGFGLDPLGVLVPFLVFAIGVSHGVQQINFIVRELSLGATADQAARRSFSGLLVPGSLALVTAFVSFITLLMIPIPMVRELAITASIGVGFKIVTNLVMLPVMASFFSPSPRYAQQAMARREQRSNWLRGLARIARPRNAWSVFGLTLVVLVLAVFNSRDRVVGTLEAGAPELRPEARFNRDAQAISQHYDIGLDWLSVVFEAPVDSCARAPIGAFEDLFVRRMRDVPGVLSVASFSTQLRAFNEGYNEGYPAMNVVPLDSDNYAALGADVARVRGFVNKDCSMSAVHLYLADHKAETIGRVISQVKRFRADNHLDGIKVRLAAGNAGVLAATDEELEHSELPMMLYVYGAIVILVLLAYRDWRAVLACCLPLTVGTFIGYWFMKELNIGLTVATLPVMVLAVGIGVDYAFYIYNRLQAHLAKGMAMAEALEKSLLEVGVATIFTAITLAIGVATWSFSELKFQADMGKLLAFMFLVNLVMAMTALPALAVVLHRVFPRKTLVRASGLFAH